MTTQTPPTQGAFFNTLQRKFQDVEKSAYKSDDGTIDIPQAINIDEFLEAAESLTTLFDILGSVAFTPVKSDMTTNIAKIRERQRATGAGGAPSDTKTLQELVLVELRNSKHRATEGLLWLTRGLDFTAQALRINLSRDNEELSTSFREAYSLTLKQYHSFLIKPIFSAAMSATPYRKDFYAKLGNDQAVVRRELDEWLKGLQDIVQILNEFFVQKVDIKNWVVKT